VHGPDGPEMQFVDGMGPMSEWWNTTVLPELSEKERRQVLGEGDGEEEEEQDDEELRLAVRHLEWTPNPNPLVSRQEDACPGKDLCSTVIYKKKRINYGDTNPKQVWQK